MVDEAAIAAKKKKEMDDEIERVKQEFEEKQKKKKEKETSKKDDKEKDSKDKKDEGKEDEKTTNEKVCNMSNHSQSNLIPTKLPLESLEEIECSCITRTKSNTRRGT